MKQIYTVILVAMCAMFFCTQNIKSQSDDYKKYIVDSIVTEDGRVGLGIVFPGRPPEHYRAPIAYPTESSHILPNVPAFNWSFGCAATSAAMIAGYYDRTDYPDMYTGPTNGGLMPMNNSSWPDWIDSYGDTKHQCPLSATHNGLDGRTTKGHVDDYWIGYEAEGPDPWVGNWTQHTYGDCTGDYMKTNQWIDAANSINVDGGTVFYKWDNGDPFDYNDAINGGVAGKDGMYGLKLFFESRGYTVINAYNQKNDYYYSNGFSFEDYKAQIDAGRPVLIHLTGHMMVGYGYDDAGQTVYLHDTWDYNNHSMIWNGSYDNKWLEGVTVIELRPLAVNVWTGATNNYWGNNGNWSLGHIPTVNENVIIPNVNMPCIVQFTDKICYDLTIQSGADVVIYDKTLTVKGNMDISGTVEMLYSSSVLTVFGHIYWYNSSTASISNSYATINVYGDWRFYSGSNANLNKGFVDFKGNSDCWVRSYTTNSSFNNFRIYKTEDAKVKVSNVSTHDLIINGLIFIISSGGLESYSNHNIILKGNFNYHGSFDFTKLSNVGSVIFDGSTQSIDNYNDGSGIFNNVVFSSSVGTTLYNEDMFVQGDLTIESGYFNPTSRNVSIGGDWINNVGTSGFVEGTSRVIFNGGNYNQSCSNETFNELEINKPLGGDLRINGTSVTCAAYDWTAGSIVVLTGNFTAGDLLDNAVQGTFLVNAGGTINLTNSGSGTWVDLKGDLHIFGGTVNITGSLSEWPYLEDASIEMNGGVLDFTSCGITVSNLHNLTSNITGGTIRTAGGFSGNRSDFTPTGGTFEFYGSSDYFISESNGCTLYNVVINKSTKGGSAATNGIPVINERSKEILSPGTKSNTISLNSDFVITNNLDIIAGTLSVGENSSLKLNDGSNLVVAAGGELKVVGTAGNEAVVTHISTGAYSFSVFGSIAAKYAIFEFMNGSSIKVNPGATVDPAYSFNNCIFRNGAPAPSALLTFNNDQVLTCSNVYFENTNGNTGYNVWKYFDAGSITFTNASGNFAGTEYEYDPYDNIHWGPVDVELDLKVMLEGPYNGTNMNTDLKTLGLIPLSQPFSSNMSADWFYSGPENVSSIPPNVVDWVLVKIKDATNAASSASAPVVAVQAAFLLNDGSVVDLDGSNNLNFTGISYSSGLFPVVWQRNHLGVISSTRMTRTGGVYTWDFTTAGSAFSNSNPGEKLLGGGVYGMYAGDVSGSGKVTSTDILWWQNDAGLRKYQAGDANLDSQADNVDKNDFCVPNIGNESQIPGSKKNNN